MSITRDWGPRPLGWNWDNKTAIMPKPYERDPYWEAEHFLRMKRVDRNDLITGEFATRLLNEWTHHLTERTEAMHEILMEQSMFNTVTMCVSAKLPEKWEETK